MKKLKFILSCACLLLMGMLAGTAFGAPAGVALVAGGLCVEPQAQVALKMAVTPEIWTDYIIQNLFKNNEFLLKSVDESQYVVGGVVVHIPNAGAPSAVKRNRTELPATVTRRQDIDVTYPLDELTTDPRFIPNADVAELSYDKMQSCMMDDMSNIQQVAADTMIYNWRPKYFIKCSATKDAKYLVHGTGVRTGLAIEDFVKAKTIFNKWNMPKEGRYVILSSEMYKQICDAIMAASNDNLSAVYDSATGQLRKFEGFEIIERSTVLEASNSSLSAVSNTQYYKWSGGTDLTLTPEKQAEIEGGGSASNTSCLYGLFWQQNAVARALGDTKMYEKQGDPTMYGDIYSFLQRLGGRARRADGKGVLGVMQEYSAS